MKRVLRQRVVKTREHPWFRSVSLQPAPYVHSDYSVRRPVGRRARSAGHSVKNRRFHLLRNASLRPKATFGAFTDRGRTGEASTVSRSPEAPTPSARVASHAFLGPSAHKRRLRRFSNGLCASPAKARTRRRSESSAAPRRRRVHLQLWPASANPGLSSCASSDSPSRRSDHSEPAAHHPWSDSLPLPRPRDPARARPRSLHSSRPAGSSSVPAEESSCSAREKRRPSRARTLEATGVAGTASTPAAAARLSRTPLDGR
eukprot:scaffold1557_cov246-Pinguiococcus_pyrenoidosus.AAC.16